MKKKEISNLFQEIKPILAIETSSRLCGVSVFFDIKKYFSSTVVEKYGHSKVLMKLINQSLENAEVTLGEIDNIAVSAGPGSFTGLRIGLSLAKGISLGSKKPICLVPTFSAMAMEISYKYNLDGEFVIASKVNTTELYLQAFESSEKKVIEKSALVIIPKDEIEIFLQGRKLFSEADNLYFSDKIEYGFPQPEFVALWSREYGKPIAYDEIDNLEPLYIKEFIPKGVVK